MGADGVGESAEVLRRGIAGERDFDRSVHCHVCCPKHVAERGCITSERLAHRLENARRPLSARRVAE